MESARPRHDGGRVIGRQQGSSAIAYLGDASRRRRTGRALEPRTVGPACRRNPQTHALCLDSSRYWVQLSPQLLTCCPRNESSCLSNESCSLVNRAGLSRTPALLILAPPSRSHLSDMVLNRGPRATDMAETDPFGMRSSVRSARPARVYPKRRLGSTAAIPTPGSPILLPASQTTSSPRSTTILLWTQH